MSREDFEVFTEIREERRVKRATQLKAADPTGWSQHTIYHWWRVVNGHKMDYWPSSNKWQYKGKMYRGSLPKWLRELMELET